MLLVTLMKQAVTDSNGISIVNAYKGSNCMLQLNKLRDTYLDVAHTSKRTIV